IFYPRILAFAGRLHVRLYIIVIEVPSDIAIELAVHGVARIAVLRAPHLHGALRIARERAHAAGSVDGRVDAAARARHGVGWRVRIDEEEADVLGGEILVDAGR